MTKFCAFLTPSFAAAVRIFVGHVLGLHLLLLFIFAEDSVLCASFHRDVRKSVLFASFHRDVRRSAAGSQKESQKQSTSCQTASASAVIRNSMIFGLRVKGLGC